MTSCRGADYMRNTREEGAAEGENQSQFLFKRKLMIMLEIGNSIFWFKVGEIWEKSEKCLNKFLLFRGVLKAFAFDSIRLSEVLVFLSWKF